MTLQLLATHSTARSFWRLWTLTILLILLGAFKAHAQPGNVCGTPIVITALPFDDAGNTSTYGNDYSNPDRPPIATDAVTNGTGSEYYLSGFDVVYAYTPSGDQVINITTTNEDGWIGLWAFTGCPFASTVGYHTSISGTTRAINSLPVQGGTTYYFVISTWASTPLSTDYTIHVEIDLSSVPCTSLPDPGATTGPENACIGTNFILGLENVASNSGISYQWEISTDGTTWANAPGTSTGATYTTMQSVTTWYRCQVTCAGNGTATSTPVQIGMNPPNECYCIPTGSANNSDEILNFTISDLNNSSTPSEGTAGYMDYTGTVPAAHLNAGAPYVASLTSNSGSGNHGAAIWIDYDDNGIFEGSEMVTSIPLTILPSTTVSFPAFTAAYTPGVHRLRVQYRYNAAGAGLDPCVASTYTETEDYLVEISGNVGLNEIALAQGVSVYPNPASTELFITTHAKPVHVKVYDMVGHLAMEVDMTSRLDIAKLAPGSYSMLITDEKGNIQAHTRFMKQ